VWPRWVAPPSIVAGQRVVGRAEVGGRDKDGRASWVAPLWVVGALYFKASTAAQPVVEERRAQRRRVHSVSLTVQVPISTRSPCISFFL